jgi:hypothetical protein
VSHYKTHYKFTYLSCRYEYLRDCANSFAKAFLQTIKCINIFIILFRETFFYDAVTTNGILRNPNRELEVTRAKYKNQTDKQKDKKNN